MGLLALNCFCISVEFERSAVQKLQPRFESFRNGDATQARVEGEGELTMSMRGALIAAVLLCGLLEAGSARPVSQLERSQGAEAGVARGRATALLRQSQRFCSEEGGSQLRLRGGMSVYGTVT